MKNKLDQIEQQLRDETPPLTASSIPDANVLLTEFRRSQTYRRTVMSIATAIVVVVAAGYLTRLGTLSLRDGNKTVAENLDVLNSDVATRTMSDSANMNATNMNTTNVVRQSQQAHRATATDSWLVEFGEMNEDGLIPLILSRYGHDGAGEATTIGFVEPPKVREVPLWQLPPQTQDAIYANWNEAGYQPDFSL